MKKIAINFLLTLISIFLLFAFIVPYLSKSDRIPLFKTNPIKTIVLTCFIFISLLFILLKITHIDFGIQTRSLKVLVPETEGPIFEEFCFRGFLLYSLLKRGSNKPIPDKIK